MDNLTHETGIINEGNNGLKGMGLLQRISGMIFSPSKVMKELEERPRVLFPLLAVGLTMLVLYLLRIELFEDFLRYVTEASAAQKNVQIEPAQMKASMKFAVPLGLIFTPVGSLFSWIVCTAVLFGMMKLFKGKGNFKQFASVTGYSYVIIILYCLLSYGASFFTGSLQLDSSLANVTNLVWPDMKGTLSYGLIRGIDLFSIWYYIVIGIGIHIISDVSKTKIYLVLGAIYLATILIGINSLRYL